MIEISTVDAHVGGTPVRLITDGAPTPRGATMSEKTRWMARHADHIRELVVLEPRGHRDMTAAMLTEPVSAGAHAGLIFMHADGYASLAGHAVLGTAYLALRDQRLVVPGGDGRSVTFDTVAGKVTAQVRDGHAVAYTSVPSFVLAGGIELSVAGRQVRADLAFGGGFYVILDAESVGLSPTAPYLAQLRQTAAAVVAAADATLVVEHPEARHLRGVAGVLFTGPPSSDAVHLRNVTIMRGGVAGRSASGTGLSALMAVVDAMGLMDDGGTLIVEGPSGSRLSGRIVGRGMVGDHPAVVPEVEGEAWPTGRHHFVLDPDDPLRHGLPFTERRS